MAYRRRQENNTWHWCKNCSKYPTSNYEEKPTKPTTGELCTECLGKEKSGNCTK